MSTLDELQEALSDLREARENLTDIRHKFVDEPDMLGFYEPSAKELVRRLQGIVDSLVDKASGADEVSNEDDDPVDVWIRIEGNQFSDGEGPINAVASVLQSVNTANQHALSLLENEDYSGGRFSKRISELATFKLARTRAGSLKIGLKRPDPYSFETQDVSLLDPWEELRSIASQSEKALKAFKLLAKAIASVQDEAILSELKEELEERSLIKLMHYAEEIAPGARSTIDRISFESGLVRIPKVIADRSTRNKIDNIVKKIADNRKYVTGTGYIRQQDLDSRTLTARPFRLTTGQKFDSIKCVFHQDVPVHEIPSYIHTAVSISGFLYLNPHGNPSKLEIDEIQEVIQDDDES